MGKSIIISCCTVFFLQLLHIGKAQTNTPLLTVKLIPVARGFTSPVGMDAPADGSKRLFVFEQGGKIKINKEGKVLDEPFLNVSSKLDGLNIAYSEKGLLGMAFHPDYKNNGKFFIYYSAKTSEKGFDHKSVIAQYKVSQNPDVALAGSEKMIMEILQPESNHNGGQLAFGNDGYLYIGLGDGGGAGDKHGSIGNGQNMNTLLGKILRIDVDHGDPYKIPEDNPFVGKENIRAEIWASGLRNPWRFSIDKVTGRLFCGDVGQNLYEEVDLIEKGKNYGWRIMEGNHCYDPPQSCNQQGLTMPIDEYDHHTGVSVIGGYVYRGYENPSLQGNYFFGDWNGKLFRLYQNDKREWIHEDVLVDDMQKNEVHGSINSFGQDAEGHVYVITQKLTGPRSPTGVVYKIAR